MQIEHLHERCSGHTLVHQAAFLTRQLDRGQPSMSGAMLQCSPVGRCGTAPFQGSTKTLRATPRSQAHKSSSEPQRLVSCSAGSNGGQHPLVSMRACRLRSMMTGALGARLVDHDGHGYTSNKSNPFRPPYTYVTTDAHLWSCGCTGVRCAGLPAQHSPGPGSRRGPADASCTGTRSGDVPARQPTSMSLLSRIVASLKQST